ncbi:hypothetical protein BDR26DRAFT_871922 [Obelidium mucronatum]|nr:hypothetical protein BDR26DRAFT_871922 [Obelidium mucronatum]
MDPLGASDLLDDPLAASFLADQEEEEEDKGIAFDPVAATRLQQQIADELEDFRKQEEELNEEYQEEKDEERERDEEGLSSSAESWEQTEDDTSHGHHQEQQHQQQINPHLMTKAKPCCNLDRMLMDANPHLFSPILTSEPLSEQPKPAIIIEETQKMSDVGTSSYTAYIIKMQLPEPYSLHLESRHRYSDFETLHRLLRRMHPTVLVPPIPEKHSVADYAVRPMSGKPKEDFKMVEARKRGLAWFLNRVAMHPILRREHVFHGFLEGDRLGKSWAEVLAGSGVSHFLKMKDVKKAANGVKITDSLLKNPDAHYLAAENYTFKFGHQLGLMTRYHKRMHKHLSETAAAGTDLGAAYNGWSLTETGPSSILAPEIEALGEAIDCTVTSQHKLIHIMEEHITEPLQNYEKLTAAIDRTLKWRHALHLESTENDAQRVAATLRSELGGGPLAQHHQQQYTSHFASVVGSSTPERALANSSLAKPSSSSLATSATATAGAAAKAMFPPVSATATATSILTSFSSFIADKDPETTRRANIQRTRERIRALESERVTHLSKLGAANEAIQKDLDRFQRDKIYDVRNMLLTMAVANRDHARRCLGAWKEAQSVIDAACGGGAGSTSVADVDGMAEAELGNW